MINDTAGSKGSIRINPTGGLEKPAILKNGPTRKIEKKNDQRLTRKSESAGYIKGWR
jgi:hypothetical protein